MKRATLITLLIATALALPLTLAPGTGVSGGGSGGGVALTGNQTVAGTKTFTSPIVVSDQATTDGAPGNRITLPPNDRSSMTADMTCTTCPAGNLCLQDSTKTSTRTWDLCSGTALIWRFPATSVIADQVLASTTTAGAMNYIDLDDAHIPNQLTLTTIDGATTFSANTITMSNNLTVSGGFAGGREVWCGGKAGSFTTDSPLTLAGGSVSVLSNPGIGYRMMRPGSIVAISIELTGTAATNNAVDFETYINGTLSMVHTRTITGTASNQGGITTQARNTSGSTFVAGDVLQLNVNLNPTTPPTLSSVVMCVETVFDS